MPSAAACSSYLELFGLALELVRREAPSHHALACRELAGMTLAVRVASEHALLMGRLQELRLAPQPAADPAVTMRIHLERGVLVRLLDGRTSLLDALHTEQLWLQAAPDELTRLSRAARALLSAAVQSPSSHAVLRRLELLESAAEHEPHEASASMRDGR